MEISRAQLIATLGTLTTLGISATFVAQGTGEVIAAEFVSPEGTVEAAGGRGMRATATKRRTDVNILSRNIITGDDITREPPPPPCAEGEAPPAVRCTPPAICTEGQTPETDGCVLPAEAATVGDGTAGPCDGNLRLVATIMSPRDPEWSMASIAQGNGGTLLYRAGSTVGGKTVKEVGAQAVLMQQGSSECFIAMFVETPAAQSRASRSGSMAVPGMMADMDDDSSMTRESARERAERRARERNAGLSTEQMNEGITRVSDTNFNVQGDLIRNVMGDQEALMRTARVIPHVEDGTTVGVKLYGIRRSSLLGRLGLQNGDMLRTINGFDMTSPDAALEAYARLQSADHLSVSILRRGQPVTIDYSVQ